MRYLRNIGIIAHIDAGKTTVSERFLFFTGRIHAVGEVHDGKATLDFDDIEKRKGITINAAATTLNWRHPDEERPCTINLVDTPGHVDFTAEVERSLRVVDGAVCVIDAGEGVEAQTETVWRQADRYGVRRIVFVNKLDKRGADFARCVAELKSRLGSSPVAIQLPWGQGDDFVGVLDVVHRTALRFEGEYGQVVKQMALPSEFVGAVEAQRAVLVDTLAGLDESLADLVLAGREAEASAHALQDALRRATVAGKVVPVLCGSALRNAGIQPLLDAVVRFLPSPAEVAVPQAMDVGTGEGARVDKDSALALVFKTVGTPYGPLSFLRLYAGRIASGDSLNNARSGRTVRIARLYRVHAERREDIAVAFAGEIVGSLGLADTRTGDTLCAGQPPMALEPIRFPQPVMAVAIEAMTATDREKLGQALRTLAMDDPTLVVDSDSQTGQLVLRGMGELHLDVTAEKLARDHGVKVRLGRPRVALREAVRSDAQTEGLHKKQSGGSGSYGHVKIRWRPLPAERWDEIEFVDATKGGSVPRQFVRHVEQGIRDAAQAGGTAGLPVSGFVAELYDGSTHSQDGRDFAFADAARIAFRAMLDTVGTTILEPVMRVSVRTPSQFTGPVIGDLSSRRGRIESMDSQDMDSLVRAMVPLAEMFGYVGDLRSLTQGRAGYTMEPAGYEPCPANVEARVRAELGR